MLSYLFNAVFASAGIRAKVSVYSCKTLGGTAMQTSNLNNVLSRVLMSALLGLALQGNAWADTPSTDNKVAIADTTTQEIPTDEKAFVASINGFSKQQIVEQFGEPSNQNDIKNAKTGKLEASIWQYHFLNKDENGEYYETTELDFIDDKVVTVVFQNNNGEDETYKLEDSAPAGNPVSKKNL